MLPEYKSSFPFYKIYPIIVFINSGSFMSAGENPLIPKQPTA